MAAPPTAVESPLRTTEQRQSPVIVFEDVSIAFESNSVLNGISFQLNRGETKAIFGIAGAGKSTILKLDMFPSELSGGMRRRVAIARAIITHPEILLYDSPTGGLDPVTSTTIIQLIVKQRDVFKTSSLLVTHRLQDAFIMASHYFDRNTNEMRPLPRGARGEVPMTFLVLREGKIIFDGDAHELAHSKDEYIREYIS